MRVKYKGYLLAADDSFVNPGRTVAAILSATYIEVFSANYSCSRSEAIKKLKEKINNNEIAAV